MSSQDRSTPRDNTDRSFAMPASDAVPYAGRAAEPSEQLAHARPGPRPAEPTPAMTIDAAPDTANTPIVADAGPETDVLAEPGNSWNARVAAESKFGRHLLPDSAQREPASPGVGPLPTYLFVAIALLIVAAVLYALTQWVA